MVKRIVCIVVVLLATATTAAQPAGRWAAWLYSSVGGMMWRVEDDGQLGGALTDSFVLPMPQGFNVFPGRPAVGHGGSPFAYVVYNDQTGQGQLVVADRDRILAGYSLPLTFSTSLEVLADETTFNEDNSLVALGFSLSGGGWSAIVLDVLTNAVTNSIRHDDPLVAALGLEAGFGLTPTVRRFSGRTVTFSMVQTGTEGAAQYTSYDWDIDADTLTLNPAFPSLDSNTLTATGEVVMALADERLANQSESFIFFQANSLQVYEPVNAARFPFYNAPDRTLYHPRFIQGGEHILVGSFDTADRSEWQVIGRDGVPVGSIPTSLTIEDARGLADGFLYVTSDFTAGATTLAYVNTRDGLDAGIPVWTSDAEGGATLLWAGDTGATAQVQVAFQPWAQLAEAVFTTASASAFPTRTPPPVLIQPQTVATGLPTPQAPAFLTFLSVGGLATVNTTEGDQLNVRNGPGVTFDVVAQLNTGARVVIVDGPRSADGFTWWKIRTASGIEGWAVESVPEDEGRLQTLIPG